MSVWFLKKILKLKIPCFTYHKPNIPGWSWRGMELPFRNINTPSEKNGHSNIDTWVAGASV